MIKTKKMNMKNLILIVILTITSFGFAQEKSEECKKNRSLAPVYAQQKMWRDAANFFLKAYAECGLEGLEKKDWNNAKIIYKNLIKAEKDETIKVGLKDSLIWVFEKGDTYGADPKWKGDFAVELIKMKSDQTEKIDSLCASSVHMLKENCSTSHIKYYYTHLVRKYNTAQGEEKEKERMFAIDEYLILSDYVDKATKKYKADGNEKKAGYYIKTQAFLDQYFVKLANDCAILTDVLGKKINSLPSDKVAKIEKVKGYLSILDKRKCTETDLYGQFADTLIVLAPSAEAYYTQGNFFAKKKNNKKAKEYYSKAIELEGDGENKGKYTYALASAQYATGSYKAAFRTAKSVQGESRGKAMIICANAIAKTSNGCGDTSFERKSNYWLANDYIKKAIALGEKVSSSTYLSSAPSDEEVFDAGKSKGQSVSLKCWSESSTIR